jgi:glycosyltransferase involved in cell wall biosynthesis
VADSSPVTRRIFLDCTRTFLTHVHTGIERMVSGLLQAAPELGVRFDATCIPLLFRTSTGFEALSEGAVQERFRPRDPATISRLTWRHRLRRELDRTGLIELVRSARGGLDTLAEATLSPVRRWLPSRIDFRPGDLIVLLDVNLRSRYWADLQRARAAGARVCLVVHDLIPLSHPGTVDEGVVREFSRWWRNAAQTVDYFLNNSESTWREVQSHLPTVVGPQRAAEVRGGWFRLGNGLHTQSGQATCRDEIRQAFLQQHGRPTYVTVGMMSPRKNHALALDALDRLWEHDSAPSLVIVGKYGWRCEEVAQRIRNHREFGRRLFWFESVTDDELDFCYRHATALLTTSFAEGFNLPIVESLSRGTPVLATDIPTHREVAGPYAAFFPPRDPDALAKVLMHPEASLRRQQVRSPATFSWPDWNASCQEFLLRLLDLDAESCGASRLGSPRSSCTVPSRRAA